MSMLTTQSQVDAGKADNTTPVCCFTSLHRHS